MELLSSELEHSKCNLQRLWIEWDDVQNEIAELGADLLRDGKEDDSSRKQEELAMLNEIDAMCDSLLITARRNEKVSSGTPEASAFTDLVD